MKSKDTKTLVFTPSQFLSQRFLKWLVPRELEDPIFEQHFNAKGRDTECLVKVARRSSQQPLVSGCCFLHHFSC